VIQAPNGGVERQWAGETAKNPNGRTSFSDDGSAQRIASVRKSTANESDKYS